MKKVEIGILIGILLVGILQPVLAESDTVTVTVTPSGTVSITISPTSVDFGTVAYGSSVNTTTNYFTLSNNGTLAVSVTVKGSNTTSWTLGSTPAYNVFRLIVTKNSAWGDADDITLTTSDQTFLSSLEPDNSQTFGLKLDMPTGGDTTAQQTITVTFTATAL